MRLIKVIGGGRSGINEANFKVVRLLERILTIPSNISMMFDETYNHYLTLTGKMIFNIKNLIIHLLLGVGTIIPNLYIFFIDFHDVRSF